VGGPAAWAMHCAPESCPAPSCTVLMSSVLPRLAPPAMASAPRVCLRSVPRSFCVIP
jgi:hypothetical protein